jgi:hypothetical protein
MYQDYIVRITFTEQVTGATSYVFPYVFSINDPKEGMKAVIIPGNRGAGSIVIPGGKKSQEIVIRGNIIDEDGYKDLTTRINEMKAEVTTNLATLTMEHKEGINWITDWTYSVRRIGEIEFNESLRTGRQEYEITLLVVAY